MKYKDKIHHHVNFALRYGDSFNSFFNASSARRRVEELIEDTKNFKEIFEATSNQHIDLLDTRIISYYAVALVSCLEWHARTRLVDLLTYKPDAFKPEDLKRINSDKTVVDMIANQAPIAVVIGASLNVSSWENYIAIFKRLLNDLEIDVDVNDYLGDKNKCLYSKAFEAIDYQEIKNLFIFRNFLVHEIGNHILGHQNIRNEWHIENAIEASYRVLRIIDRIECLLKEQSPSGFPNLIDEHGYEISKEEVLKEKIDIFNQKILERIEDSDKENNGYSDYPNWSHNFNEIDQMLRKEIKLINESVFLHNRYIDYKSPLVIRLLQNRLEFLKLLSEI